MSDNGNKRIGFARTGVRGKGLPPESIRQAALQCTMDTMPSSGWVTAFCVICLLGAGACSTTPRNTGNHADAGDQPDAGSAADAGEYADAGESFDGGGYVDAGACVVFPTGSSCNMGIQAGTPVIETQVATEAPSPLGGFYNGGLFVLTASIVYTGVDGGTGPDGISYAMTLRVKGTGSTDVYDVVATQSGCADSRFEVSVNTTDLPPVAPATWSCPSSCPTCAASFSYTGTNEELTQYFPGPNGSTVARVFTWVNGGM